MTLPAVPVPDETAKATLTRDNPAPGGTAPGAVEIIPPPDAKAADQPKTSSSE